MKSFVNYLGEKGIFKAFSKFVEQEHLANKDFFIRYTETIETIVDDIINMGDSKIKELFYSFNTAIDLSRKIVKKYSSGGEGGVTYEKLEEIIKKSGANDEEQIGLKWKKILATMREYYQHDGGKVEIKEVNGRLYVQCFREEKYPTILEFMGSDNYVDFSMFMTYKLACLLEYSRIIFEYLINEYSSFKLEALFELCAGERGFISNDNLSYLDNELQRANKVILLYTDEYKMNCILYKELVIPLENDNDNKRNNKKATLNKLKKEIEKGELSHANPYLISDVYYYLGNICLFEEKFEEARENYVKALKYNVSAAILANYLKVCLQSDFSEDINSILEIFSSYEKEFIRTRDNTELAVYYNNIGVFLAKYNYFDDAEEFYRKSYSFNANQDEALYNLAILYKKQGVNRFKDAINLLTKVVQRNKNDIYVYKLIIELAFIIKEQDICEKYLVEMLTYNPKNIECTDYCMQVLKSVKVNSQNELCQKLLNCINNFNLKSMKEDEKERINELKAIIQKLS